MDVPKDLSIAEIRNYMILNNGKVTNHALVKHFKRFLTNPQHQEEARKKFKTYVTLLSTIKNENNQKFLILRKKYVDNCPSEEATENAITPATNDTASSSKGNGSGVLDLCMESPLKPPMEAKLAPRNGSQEDRRSIVKFHKEVDNYTECVNELTSLIKNNSPVCSSLNQASVEIGNANKKKTENIPQSPFTTGASVNSNESFSTAAVSGTDSEKTENPISVKEATRKFNRMASDEEARIISPPSKKKPEKQLIEETELSDATLAHPKAKEWIVSIARSNYQELAKLASDYPELVKLQDPATGYTALHWAAKHGNENVVKLIAGTYKVDVNAKTNGGYTPLHLAVQFGRENIFELLWNVYKANRDIMDWSGNKPLDYSRQRPSVSASTYSSEYQNYFLSMDLTSNYHLGPQNYENMVPSDVVELNYETLSNELSRGKKRYASIRAGTSANVIARTHSLLIPNSMRRKKTPSVQSLVVKNDAEHSKKKDHYRKFKANEYTEEIDDTATKPKQSFLRKKLLQADGGNRPTEEDDVSANTPNIF